MLVLCAHITLGQIQADDRTGQHQTCTYPIAAAVNFEQIAELILRLVMLPDSG